MLYVQWNFKMEIKLPPTQIIPTSLYGQLLAERLRTYAIEAVELNRKAIRQEVFEELEKGFHEVFGAEPISLSHKNLWDYAKWGYSAGAAAERVKIKNG